MTWKETDASSDQGAEINTQVGTVTAVLLSHHSLHEIRRDFVDLTGRRYLWSAAVVSRIRAPFRSRAREEN